MPTTWSSTHNGSPDPDDADTAIAAIDAENASRAAQNLVLAAQEPPGTPIPLLPKGNASQVNASIDVILTKETNDLWIGKKKALQNNQGSITQAQRDTIVANLTRRNRAGETWDQLVTDTAS